MRLHCQQTAAVTSLPRESPGLGARTLSGSRWFGKRPARQPAARAAGRAAGLWQPCPGRSPSPPYPAAQGWACPRPRSATPRERVSSAYTAPHGPSRLPDHRAPAGHACATANRAHLWLWHRRLQDLSGQRLDKCRQLRGIRLLVHPGADPVRTCALQHHRRRSASAVPKGQAKERRLHPRAAQLSKPHIVQQHRHLSQGARQERVERRQRIQCLEPLLLQQPGQCIPLLALELRETATKASETGSQASCMEP